MTIANHFRCVVYYRCRPREPDASEEAMLQQQGEVRKLCETGAEIVAEFTEIESAEPDEGFLEERPQLILAYEEARKLRCSVEILRADPIGIGDKFETNAIPGKVQDVGFVSIHCDTGLADQLLLEEATMEGTSVPDAVIRRLEDKANAQRPPFSIQTPEGAPPGLSIFVDLSFGRREAPVYLCNSTDGKIGGYFEDDHQRDVAGDPDFADSDPRVVSRFSVEPGCCQWLLSFEQGRWRGETSLFRFFFEGSREDHVADLSVAGGRFKETWRTLIPTCIDHDLQAHWRRPMVMICQG